MDLTNADIDIQNSEAAILETFLSSICIYTYFYFYSFLFIGNRFLDL